MAEDYKFDSCVSLNTSITESNSETDGIKQSVDQNVLFLEEHSSPIVSPAGEETETARNISHLISESLTALRKKSNSEFESEVFVQESQEIADNDSSLVPEGIKGKQEILEDDLVSRNDGVLELKCDDFCNVVALTNSQLISSGTQGFDGFSKNSTTGLSKKCEEALKDHQPMNVQSASVGVDCSKGFESSPTALGEIESESLLIYKEKQFDFEPKEESVSGAKPYVLKSTDFEFSRSILDDRTRSKEDIDHSSSIGEKFGIVGNSDTDEKENICNDIQKIWQSDFEKLDVIKGIGGAIKSSLKIEVIDETALIDASVACASKAGIRHKNIKGLSGSAKNYERNGHKRNVKQEMKQQVKWRQKRGKGGKIVSEKIEKHNILTHMDELHIECEKKKIVYSRKEMEAMRYVNFGEQKKKWMEVYDGLGPTVAGEYDGLVVCNHQKHIQVNFDPRPGFVRRGQPPAILGSMAANGRGNHLKAFCVLKNGPRESARNYTYNVPNNPSFDLYA